jgi:hypothetical protein
VKQNRTISVTKEIHVLLFVHLRRIQDIVHGHWVAPNRSLARQKGFEVPVDCHIGPLMTQSIPSQGYVVETRLLGDVDKL